MSKIVTYLGKRDKNPDTEELSVAGIYEPFHAGKPVTFDDSFAKAHGVENPDDFAEFIVAVYNQNRGDHPLFSIQDAPKVDSAKQAKEKSS